MGREEVVGREEKVEGWFNRVLTVAKFLLKLGESVKVGCKVRERDL